MTGKEKIVQQLIAENCNYIFGNPGTTEEGILEVIDRSEEIQYITCLHETVAIAMADGYARKTKKLGVVQLHSGVGVGNGIGMIYQAFRGHAPLLIFAGDPGVKYDALEGIAPWNLVDMAKPVTKWATRIVHKDTVLSTLRKAIKIAMTPPCGPVFVGMPMDILDEENEEEVVKTSVVDTVTRPGKDTVAFIARILENAVNPIFIIGDGIDVSNAKEELEGLAGALGAKVYGADNSVANFNHELPNYKGDLGHMSGENSKELIQDADVIFIVGTYMFPEVFPLTKNPFPKNAAIIQIDINGYEIAKNYPVTVGLQADPKATLQEILARIEEGLSDTVGAKIAKRMQNLEKEKKEYYVEDTSIVAQFVKELYKKTEGKAIIFDESLTSSTTVNTCYPIKEKGMFFQTRGGSLGVGIPGAMGIKLAAPDKAVVAFTGDGGSMYTIQALQTATRYHIDVKIIILVNGGYKLLKNNIQNYWNDDSDKKNQIPDCFSIKPVVDYVELAHSMGVPGTRVRGSDEIEGAVKEMMEYSGAYLVELIVD